MYHSEEIVRQLQSQKILAMKLDRAVRAVGEEVKNHLSHIGAGAQRLLYYTSCFTDEYYDVCTRQNLEDARFRKGIFHLVSRWNIVFDIINTYVEELVKDFSPAELAAIQHALIRANVYISTSTLTSYSFSAGVASTVCLYVTIPPSGVKVVSGLTCAALGGLGIYGVVQKAAESARRLQVMHPAYYQALYLRELEMMYFLVEPAFMRAGVLTQQWTDSQSPYGAADSILKLMGRH
ncbi:MULTISPECIES: hypothetical protein [Enterobacter]|uniref:hypothetical protein n=1 Tax=Enterobacter TaxID=547 RepID=UPI001867C62F|nr:MULTISPECIES: hypothetical protein [Enterobacter]MBE3207452.1 hypothetical protein [Enterobacter cloacae complex sp. P32C]MBY6298416.1 hypothetical protein [Enterobacter bugandensis]MCK6733694.1 hypothetical protein [Enterobacter bugandensis]MCM7428890.1 hypothetical protein [Enterobacter bugandensis]HCM9225249.1 hypothetical protein [Enterobacter bugandensis]